MLPWKPWCWDQHFDIVQSLWTKLINITFSQKNGSETEKQVVVHRFPNVGPVVRRTSALANHFDRSASSLAVSVNGQGLGDMVQPCVRNSTSKKAKGDNFTGSFSSNDSRGFDSLAYECPDLETTEGTSAVNQTDFAVLVRFDCSDIVSSTELLVSSC